MRTVEINEEVKRNRIEKRYGVTRTTGTTTSRQREGMIDLATDLSG